MPHKRDVPKRETRSQAAARRENSTWMLPGRNPARSNGLDNMKIARIFTSAAKCETSRSRFPSSLGRVGREAEMSIARGKYEASLGNFDCQRETRYAGKRRESSRKRTERALSRISLGARAARDTTAEENPPERGESISCLSSL